MSGRQLALVGNSGGRNILQGLPPGNGRLAGALGVLIDGSRPQGTSVGLYYTPSSGYASNLLVPGTHSLAAW